MLVSTVSKHWEKEQTKTNQKKQVFSILDNYFQDLSYHDLKDPPIFVMSFSYGLVKSHSMWS